MSTSNAQRLLELSERLGALQYGEFTLSSGAKSDYYFDGRLVTLDAEGAYLVGRSVRANHPSEGRRGHCGAGACSGSNDRRHLRGELP